MSLCDTCLSPGACCKRLALSGPFAQPMSRERVEHLLMSPEWHSQGVGNFRPGDQDEHGVWRFWCTQLLPDGRCGIYQDRPHLCRIYRPGQDAMCVHHWADPE